MLEEKLKYWIDKYDTDVEAKQHELDTLKVRLFHAVVMFFLSTV